VKIREYSGPLTVFLMGILGFSLFCVVSAVAMADPSLPNASAMEPQGIVDSAFSNLNTMAALTVEVISDYVGTPTPAPSDTITPRATLTASNTPAVFSTFTPRPPTRTREPRSTATLTPTRTPSRVPSMTPSNTPMPSLTPSNTPLPTFTRTPDPTHTDIPDTDTPVPDTDTPVPDTDTPVPIDTDTPVPIDTPTIP